MSQKAASDFIGRLAVDATLRGELAAALADAPGRPQSLSRMVEFAARHGLEVTAEELADFALVPGNPDELSDEQLSRVAGGIGIGPGYRPPSSSPPIGKNCGGWDCACQFNPVTKPTECE